MIDGLHQWTSADGAVEGQPERAVPGPDFMAGLPADAQRSGVAGERFGLCVPAARPAANGPPDDDVMRRGVRRGCPATITGVDRRRRQEQTENRPAVYRHDVRVPGSWSFVLRPSKALGPLVRGPRTPNQGRTTDQERTKNREPRTKEKGGRAHIEFARTFSVPSSGSLGRGRGAGAPDRALHQVPHERDFVAVVPQR